METNNFWKDLYHLDLSKDSRHHIDDYKRFYIQHLRKIIGFNNVEARLNYAVNEGLDCYLNRCLESIDRGAEILDKLIKIAIMNNQERIVVILLNHGIKNLNPALIQASMIGNDSIVLMLLKCGATDINTAMNMAAIRGYTSTVKILLDHGANDFATAIRYASYKGYNKTAEIIKSSMQTKVISKL